jgi:hypothetical protein
MVIGNENTIKLIYAIRDITLMLIYNMSGAWSKGHNTTFRRSDRDHDKGEVRPNGNAPCMVEGNGNCTVTGDADSLGHYKTFGGWP